MAISKSKRRLDVAAVEGLTSAMSTHAYAMNSAAKYLLIPATGDTQAIARKHDEFWDRWSQLTQDMLALTEAVERVR